MFKLVCVFLEISYVLSSQNSCLIFISSISSEKELCAGGLISNKWVLTAAQCVYRAPAKTVRVYNNKKDQHRLVLEIFLHEDFDFYENINDVALLRVKNPFDINEDTHPCCIHNQDEKIVCSSSGCVKKEKAGAPKNFYLLGIEGCRKYFKDTVYVNRITDNVNCYFGATKYLKPLDYCKALPGYPLTSQSDLGEKVLTGILNIGWTCSFFRYPSVFTKISSYYKWVKDITAASDFNGQITCFQDRKYVMDVNNRPNFFIGKDVLLRNADRDKRMLISSQINDKIGTYSPSNIFLRFFGSPQGNLDTSFFSKRKVLQNFVDKIQAKTTVSYSTPDTFSLTQLVAEDRVKERVLRQDDGFTTSSYVQRPGPMIAPPIPGVNEDSASIVIEEPGGGKGSAYLMVQFPDWNKNISNSPTIKEQESQQGSVLPQDSKGMQPPILYSPPQMPSPQSYSAKEDGSDDIACEGNTCFPGMKEKGKNVSDTTTGTKGGNGTNDSNVANGGNGANGTNSANGAEETIGASRSDGKISHFLLNFDGDIIGRRPAHEIILKANKFLNLDIVKVYDLRINFRKFIEKD